MGKIVQCFAAFIESCLVVNGCCKKYEAFLITDVFGPVHVLTYRFPYHGMRLNVTNRTLKEIFSYRELMNLLEFDCCCVWVWTFDDTSLMLLMSSSYIYLDCGLCIIE